MTPHASGYTPFHFSSPQKVHSSSDWSVRKGLLWSISVMPSCFHEHRLNLHRDLLTLLCFFPFSLVTVNSCFFCSMLYSLQLLLCIKWQSIFWLKTIWAVISKGFNNYLFSPTRHVLRWASFVIFSCDRIVWGNVIHLAS